MLTRLYAHQGCMLTRVLSWYWNRQVSYPGKIDVKRTEMLYSVALYISTPTNNNNNNNNNNNMLKGPLDLFFLHRLPVSCKTQMPRQGRVAYIA